MSNVVQMPDRTRRQRLESLAKGNKVRTHRAKLKKSIKAGTVNPGLIVAEPYELVESMKIIDLLLAVPKVGDWKARKILEKAMCSPSKTLGGLTPRQRAAVCSALDWEMGRSEGRVAA